MHDGTPSSIVMLEKSCFTNFSMLYYSNCDHPHSVLEWVKDALASADTIIILDEDASGITAKALNFNKNLPAARHHSETFQKAATLNGQPVKR